METRLDILQESSSMTNVTIVYCDGIIHTHKIVLASASDFMKHLLSDIPVGDEITLYLPDHGKDSFDELLDGVFSSLHKERSCLDNFLECDNVFQSKESDVISQEDIKEEEVKFGNDFDFAIKLVDNNEDCSQYTVRENCDIKKKTRRGSIKVFHHELPEEVNELVDSRINDLEKQMLEHPSDSAMYKKLLKQILYEKARMEVMRSRKITLKTRAIYMF